MTKIKHTDWPIKASDHPYYNDPLVSGKRGPDVTLSAEQYEYAARAIRETEEKDQKIQELCNELQALKDQVFRLLELVKSGVRVWARKAAGGLWADQVNISSYCPANATLILDKEKS